MSGINRIFSKKEIDLINGKISKLGSAKITTNDFLKFRLLGTILVFIIALSYSSNLLIPPLLAIFSYFIIYYIIIEIPSKKRIKKLEKEGLEFFEILALTLENNRNLEKSLEIITFNLDSELSNEFKKCLFELKFGKSLNEALENMQMRIPSDTINNIILNIIETNNFGNDIIGTLYAQVEFLREKEIQEIKETINKIPNKISVISVLFFIPLILLMILGPMILKLVGGNS